MYSMSGLSGDRYSLESYGSSVLSFLFFRWISLLISFEPSLKLAFPGTLILTRITQSCPFLPMIDLRFGFAFAREYFPGRASASSQALLGVPLVSSGRFRNAATSVYPISR